MNIDKQAKVDEMWSIIKEWITSEAVENIGYKKFKSFTSEFFWTPELIEESSKIESMTLEAQNLQDNSNSDDNDVTEAYRKLRDANEAFRDRLYKRRVEVFHSIVTDLAQPQNNGSFMRMVRSVKKRKLKDHCQLDHRNINQHMDYFKSTFGSAPMGNYMEEVNVDVENDEFVVVNENLLNNDVNLNDDNESILLEEPSSISSLNSININQSNANHGISNLPDSNLCSSSPSPSDLGEVMLIDLPCPSSNSNSTYKSDSNHINNHALPYQVDASSNVNHGISNLPASHSPILCSPSPSSSDLEEVMLIDLPGPSSISNSTSISNSNLINNQTLPCQVDASNSTPSLKLSSSSKSLKGKSLQSKSKRNSNSKSSKSILSYFKNISKFNRETESDFLEFITDGNNTQEKLQPFRNSSRRKYNQDQNLSFEKLQSLDIVPPFMNSEDKLKVVGKQKKGINSSESPHTVSKNTNPVSNSIFCKYSKDTSAFGNETNLPEETEDGNNSPEMLQHPTPMPHDSDVIVDCPYINIFNLLKKGNNSIEMFPFSLPSRNSLNYPLFSKSTSTMINDLPFPKEGNNSNSEVRFARTTHQDFQPVSYISSNSLPDPNFLLEKNLPSIAKKGNNSVHYSSLPNVSKSHSISSICFKDISNLVEYKENLESDSPSLPRNAVANIVKFTKYPNKAFIYDRAKNSSYSKTISSSKNILLRQHKQTGELDFHPISCEALGSPMAPKSIYSNHLHLNYMVSNWFMPNRLPLFTISSSFEEFKDQLEKSQKYWDTNDFHPVSTIFRILSKIYIYLYYRNPSNADLTLKKGNNSGERLHLSSRNLSSKFKVKLDRDPLPDIKKGNNSKVLSICMPQVLPRLDFQPVSSSAGCRKNEFYDFNTLKFLDNKEKGNNSGVMLPSEYRPQNDFNPYLQAPDLNLVLGGLNSLPSLEILSHEEHPSLSLSSSKLKNKMNLPLKNDGFQTFSSAVEPDQTIQQKRGKGGDNPKVAVRSGECWGPDFRRENRMNIDIDIDDFGDPAEKYKSMEKQDAEKGRSDADERVMQVFQNGKEADVESKTMKGRNERENEECDKEQMTLPGHNKRQRYMEAVKVVEGDQRKGMMNKTEIECRNDSKRGDVEKEVEEGGVKEKGDRMILEGDEGGVDVSMDLEFNQVEEELEKGGVKELGGVVERDLHIMKLKDDKGGVLEIDKMVDLKFDHVETGSVKKKKGVVEKNDSKFDKKILEHDEGGVMGEVDEKGGVDGNKTHIEKGRVMCEVDEKGGVDVSNGKRIKEGGVMGEDNKKGCVIGKNVFQFIKEGGVMENGNMKRSVDVNTKIEFMGNKNGKEVEEGGVIGKDKRKGSVDVNKKIKFIDIKTGTDAEEGGVMDSYLFFGLQNRNIKRGEGSVRKRKNSNHFIANQEDESSINSFFSRRKRSRFNFVINEEQAKENEILENHNESRVDQNESYRNESEFRAHQSQDERHINRNFSINENINGGEGGVQSSVSGDQGGIQIENNQSQGDEGGVNNDQLFNFQNLITKESILVNIKNMALGKALGTDGLMAEVYYYG
ncbi:hypothetical protein ROZALSC1DRAFT_23896, partial [Rozella allomycis CSF55]